MPLRTRNQNTCACMGAHSLTVVFVRSGRNQDMRSSCWAPWREKELVLFNWNNGQVFFHLVGFIQWTVMFRILRLPTLHNPYTYRFYRWLDLSWRQIEPITLCMVDLLWNQIFFCVFNTIRFHSWESYLDEPADYLARVVSLWSSPSNTWSSILKTVWIVVLIMPDGMIIQG